MPQSPLLVDQLQVEPGESGTRLINRSADGDLQFQDPNVTVLLKNMVGARNITGVFVVGRAGDGAPYTTVQSALDAIPSSSSSSAPSLVLVYPGEYTGNLTVQRDGVFIQGLGDVVLKNSGDSDTLTVSAAIASTPQKVTLKGLRIENDQAARSCVRVIGADTFATGTVTVATAPLTAGDTLTIGGTVLTGIAGTRASGSNNFSVLGGTVDAIAAEITAALNDSGNSFATSIEASVVGAVITLTAVTAGSGGNAITLATSTVGLTLSGANLTGGGAAGSLVASEDLLVQDCDLVATGNGGYQFRADTSNYLEVRGGTFRDSASTTLISVSNCSRFFMSGVEWANDVELAYDTGNDRPSDTDCDYEVSSVLRLDEVSVNLSGAGSMKVRNCPEMAGLSQDGDQALTVTSSYAGALTLDGTTAATLQNSFRSSLTVAGGTPTLQEPVIRDTLAFAASASESYSFTATQPDTNYTVLLESPTTASVLGVASKTTSGFDVEASVALTGTVGIIIRRDL